MTRLPRPFMRGLNACLSADRDENGFLSAAGG